MTTIRLAACVRQPAPTDRERCIAAHWHPIGSFRLVADIRNASASEYYRPEAVPRGGSQTRLCLAAPNYENVSMKYSPLRNEDGSPNIAPTTAAYACMGFGMCAALFGLNLWVWPPSPPFHDRVAWMYSLGTNLFGSQGPAIVMWIFAALLLGLGVAAWARARG
jgi:hypothetical protein